MFDLKMLQRLIMASIILTLWVSVVIVTGVLVVLMWWFRVAWPVTAAVAALALLLGLSVGALAVALGPKVQVQEKPNPPA